MQLDPTARRHDFDYRVFSVEMHDDDPEWIASMLEAKKIRLGHLDSGAN